MNNNQSLAPLDLSKLKPCQLPQGVFAVQLKGDVDIDPETGVKMQRIQNIPIHPLSGAGLIAWGENPKNDPDGVTFEERACLTALIYGADMSEESAKLLMEYDHVSAKAISQAVWVATSRWKKAQKAEEDIAEKKLRTGRDEYGRLIHLCRKTGDLSPLLPLSMRDMIWLQVDERLEETGTVELRKSELAIQRERVRIILSILSDIRHIHLAMMPFKNDLAFHDFLTTLPSFKGDAKKEKAERRWKVKKRKPGEEPAWKKKIVDTENKS